MYNTIIYQFHLLTAFVYYDHFRPGTRSGDYGGGGSGISTGGPQQLLISANSSLLREFYQNSQSALQLRGGASSAGTYLYLL